MTSLIRDLWRAISGEDFFEHASPEQTDWPRDDENGPGKALGHTHQAIAHEVFEGLKSCQNINLIADLDLTGDRLYPGIAQPDRQPI